MLNKVQAVCPTNKYLYIGFLPGIGLVSSKNKKDVLQDVLFVEIVVMKAFKVVKM